MKFAKWASSMHEGLNRIRTSPRLLSPVTALLGPDLRQITLTVTANNEAAVGLYRAAGFEAYGLERCALMVDGVMYDNVHMARTF